LVIIIFKTKKVMATKIAQYKFDNEHDFLMARVRISSEVGTYSSHGWDYSNSYYEIYIYDDCDNPTNAGRICRSHGGIAFN
jgi:hypothetical protein